MESEHSMTRRFVVAYISATFIAVIFTCKREPNKTCISRPSETSQTAPLRVTALS
jgi:hypothetical protein